MFSIDITGANSALLETLELIVDETVEFFVRLLSKPDEVVTSGRFGIIEGLIVVGVVVVVAEVAVSTKTGVLATSSTFLSPLMRFSNIRSRISSVRILLMDVMGDDGGDDVGDESFDVKRLVVVANDDSPIEEYADVDGDEDDEEVDEILDSSSESCISTRLRLGGTKSLD